MDGQAAPLPSAILDARGTIERALRRLGRKSDERLARGWSWRGRAQSDARNCYYRALELLNGAAVALGPHPRPEAARVLALVTEARWDLHGLLVALPDALLDRHPGAGEWTLRQTLGHVLDVQERYALATIWAIERLALEGEQPVVRPGHPARPTPDPAAAAPGAVGDVRRRLDELVDRAIEALAHVDAERELTAPAVWAGYDVDVRFRLHRMAPHLQEHTVQLEKTLVLLDEIPTEVDRLTRLVARAYGRLEGAALGTPSPDLSAVGDVEQLAATL